ncbi:hypothetical protein, partial [Chromobacterium violaceum]|uniref:hypothetical protein n=1 Tax=Chromobacterium violaceum TaxID=536 RepID=UPI001A959BD3
ATFYKNTVISWHIFDLCNKAVFCAAVPLPQGMGFTAIVAQIDCWSERRSGGFIRLRKESWLRMAAHPSS